MFETVLLPIDQSREAIETVGKAVQLAQSHSSRLVMLSVVQPERPDMNDTDAIASLLDKAKKEVELSGIECEIIERQGNPAFVICDVADELNVDVIVMGTRGINLENNNESTASRVIQLAPCPVLIVP